MTDGPDQSPMTIPHHGCRTPGECRREQICLDAWWCSSHVPVRELLAEGLDLCVRARTLDEAVASIPRPDGAPRSGTPHLWVLDQYDRDLAEWEAKARRALSA